MKYASSSNREKGAALISSLIFLTVLTILGMSTLGTSLLESRMAGNLRDRNLAFQAAEMGLRDAELFILKSGRIQENILIEMKVSAETTEAGDYTGQGCTYGFCYNGSTWRENGDNWMATPVWKSDGNWANAIQYQRDDATTGKGVGRGTTKLAFAAAYALPAKLPLVSRQPEYLIESYYPKTSMGTTRYYYRITVRGYGMRSGTRILLQEVYTP